MGARFAMMRLAGDEPEFVLMRGDWTSPSELLPASGGCQRPDRDMSTGRGFVNAWLGCGFVLGSVLFRLM
jgi:hypothetical protein